MSTRRLPRRHLARSTTGKMPRSCHRISFCAMVCLLVHTRDCLLIAGTSLVLWLSLNVLFRDCAEQRCTKVDEDCHHLWHGQQRSLLLWHPRHSRPCLGEGDASPDTITYPCLCQHLQANSMTLPQASLSSSQAVACILAVKGRQVTVQSHRAPYGHPSTSSR